MVLQLELAQAPPQAENVKDSLRCIVGGEKEFGNGDAEISTFVLVIPLYWWFTTELVG